MAQASKEKAIRSMRWQITIGNTSIVAAVLLCFGIYMYLVTYTSLQEDLKLHTTHLQRQMEVQFENTVEAPLGVIASLKQQLVDEPQIDQLEVLNASISALVSSYPSVEKLMIVDDHAQVVLSAPMDSHLQQTSVLNESFYINRPLDDSIRWSDVTIDAQTGEPTVIGSTRVGDYLLICDLNLEQMRSFLIQDTYQSLVSISILDAYGNYLLDTDEKKVAQRLRHPEFELLKTHEGQATTFMPSNEDQDILYSIIPIGEAKQWHLVIAESKKVLYQPLYNLLNSLVIGFGAMLLCSMLFLYLNFKKISRELSHLIEGTKEIASGNYEYLFETSEYGEIQTLTEHFEVMVHQISTREEEIKALNDNLETNVESLENLNQELEEAMATAVEASQIKGQFLANMSHEIRTPMNGMVGMLNLLESTPLSQEQDNYVKKLRHASDGLLLIINDILDYSKLEAGKLSLSAHVFSVKGLMEEVDSLFRTNAQHKNLKLFVITHSAVEDYYFGDSHRLKQVLANLVSNALKFTHAGAIHVSVVPEGPYLNFEVLDTGIGISEENQKELFKRFNQIDQKSGQKTNGTGLGLAISKMIVDLMGGVIGIESRLGQGSRFFFSLALPTATSDQLAKKEKEDAERHYQLGNLEGLKVLIVEDDPTSSFLVCTLLEKHGAEVHAASDGLKALEYLSKDSVDLVFMDVNMPYLDGLQATRRLRSERKHARNGHALPIVAMTAYALTTDKERCMAAGMNDYLSKPVNIFALSQVIRQFWQPRTEQQKNVTNTQVENQILITEAVERPKSMFLVALEALMAETLLDRETCTELLSVFLQQAQELMMSIKMAVNQQEWLEALAALHRLKGSAGNVRANHIMQFAKAAEAALKEEDYIKGTAIIQALESSVESFTIGA